MQQSLFFLLTISGVVLEVFGDVILKSWSNTGKLAALVLGFAIYFVGSVCWIFSLKYEYLSKALAVFTVLNLIVGTIAGVLIFKEHLTATQKIGIVLGILSILLIEGT
jgi:multidrug transporter EmrE-like cation transporter